MYVLGISAYYHDSAVALIKNEKIIAAAAEERFTRVKNDDRFPHLALDYVLHEAQITIDEIDAIVFYEKPLLKFERIIETFLKETPFGARSFKYGLPLMLKKFFFKHALLKEINKHHVKAQKVNGSKLYFSTHHLSHAASAFFASPFAEALVLTCDGVGEWASTGVFLGRKNELTPLQEIHFPHSLGLLYSTFTALLGFKVNEGEYKVMGLAPYGQAIYLEVFERELINVASDGSFKLNMKYFNFHRSEVMYTPELLKLVNLNKARDSHDDMTQNHMDIASSLQKLLERVLLKVLRALAQKYPEENLCLAGGVALNCVANGLIERAGLFQNIWIQPAAGDAGGSLGAALAFYHLHTLAPRTLAFPDHMNGSKLGPAFSQISIDQLIDEANLGPEIQVQKYTQEEDLLNYCLEALTTSRTIGWFQGRMEFGPRALGNRSILADPRAPQMQKTLNLKIKFRESFRPFAPIILEEDGPEWFENFRPSPYMLKVYQLKETKRLPMSESEMLKRGLAMLERQHCQVAAVTHIDYSSRVQSLRKADQPRLYQLIKKFKDKTGIPMLVNTSFNLKDEPIVCTPADALACFLKSGLDILVLEDMVLTKRA